MKIEKDRTMPGHYVAESLNLVAIGNSLVEALDRWFEKYYWAHDLKRNEN